MPQVLKDEIREKIIKAALQEYTERGYASTSMKVIAAGSGIAVGNIYRYFKNKEELYDAVSRPVYDAINNLFDSPPETPNLQGLENKVQGFINIYRQNKRVFIMLLDRSEETKFEHMKKTIILNFSRAIIRWRKQMSGITADPEEQVFIQAFTTAYISGIVSILSNPDDDKTMTGNLYTFLTFMKDGLLRKYSGEEKGQ